MASASDLPKLYQGVQKQSFGYKMLSTMGWKEGQGLGANNQGIKEHIKVKKKQDAFGVGAAEQAHKLRDWTTGMVGYDAILSGLREITRGSSAPDSSDNSSSGASSSSSRGHSSGYDSDSDTSSDAAARAAAKKKQKKGVSGGKATKGVSKADKGVEEGKKKKRKQQQDAEVAAAKRHKQATKSKAAASSDSSSSDSGDSDAAGEPGAATTATAAAAATAGVLNVSRVKSATHLGRYAKRERAKTVRNYSASDLAAILGVPSSAPVVQGGEGADAWAAAAAAAAGVNADAQARSSSSSSSDDDDDGSSSSSDDGSDSGSDSDSRQGSEQRLRPGTPPGSDTPPSRAQQGLLGGTEVEGAAAAVDAAADGKAWWRSVFVKCGGSGSSLGMRPGSSKAINAHGFLEDDQTNLYMQAHATATTGKQGLGRSSMPKKVAGARWQGTKTKLGSDDEDDQEAEQQQQQQDAATDSLTAAAAAAGREQYVKNGIVIIRPVKKQPAGEGTTGVQQQQEDGGTNSKKAKKKVKQAAGAADASLTGQQADADAATPAAAGSKKRKQQKEQHAAAGGSSKKSKQADVCSQPAAAAAAGGGEPTPKSVKWAKLAAKVLEGAPKRRMRIQKLHKKVVAAAGYDVSAPGVDTEVLYQQMLKKLRKAQGLEVCEKYVGLSAQ